jgi:oligopeptide transport system substrate-binding protein
MVKNDKYWDPDSTKVETITYKLMSDDNAILAAFKNNELDLIDTFPSDETVSLEATPEFHRFGNLGLYYLQVNHEAGSTADAEE